MILNWPITDVIGMAVLCIIAIMLLLALGIGKVQSWWKRNRP